MIATPPPVAVRVNGRLIGYVGSRYRGNVKHVSGAALEIERIKRLPPAQQRQAAQALRRENPRRNQLGTCGYCGGPGGVFPGADHSIQCPRYRKPTRRVKTISRRNPTSGCRPGETEIYSDVERIFAKKGRRSHVAGEKFVHRFKHAVACGCKDGTVVLRGHGGRRLWNLFRA